MNCENKISKKNVYWVIILAFLILSIVLLILSTQPVSAYTPLTDLGGAGTISDDSAGFSSYLNSIFKTGIGIASVLAILMIVVGGIQYITSFIPSAKENAKKRIGAALMGLILVLISWVILYTINPDILTLNLDIQKVSQKKSPKPSEIPMYWFEWKYSSQSTYKEKGSYTQSGCEPARAKFVTQEKKDGKTVDSKSCFKKITKKVASGFYFTWGKSKSTMGKNREGPYETALLCNNGKKKIIKKEIKSGAGIVYTTTCLSSKKQGQDTPREIEMIKALPTHAGLLAIATKNGIGVKSNICTANPKNLYNCTTLAGLPISTFTDLRSIKDQCEKDTGKTCGIFITGGTELSHTTHGVGRKIVDLRKNIIELKYLNLTNWIIKKGGMPRVTAFGLKYTINGVTFLNERAGTPHWHVVL